jgi:hypothetical protein
MSLSDLVSLVGFGRIALGTAVLAIIVWVVVPRLRAGVHSRGLHTDRRS